MKAPVSALPVAVTHRCCPGCGYLISQRQIDALLVSVPCTRCGGHTTTNFQPIRFGGYDK